MNSTIFNNYFLSSYFTAAIIALLSFIVTCILDCYFGKIITKENSTYRHLYIGYFISWVILSIIGSFIVRSIILTILNNNF